MLPKATEIIKVFVSFMMILNSVFISNLKAQGEIEIDPRQYVTVTYKKVPTSGLLDTIWNWERRKNVPNQKFYFLDADGSIKIVFDKKNLSLNRDFEGTFSLEAEISGPNGTRRIEVNPYSEIGVQRRPIGVKSDPPTEIANKLLNILREVNSKSQSDYPYYLTSDDFQYRLQRLRFSQNEATTLISSIENDLRKAKFDTIALLDKAKNLRNRVLSGRLGFYVAPSDSSAYSNYFENYKDKGDGFKAQFENFKNFVNQKIDQNSADLFTGLKAVYDFVNTKTDIIIEYLNSFESSGDDALKAFLTFINKDPISYKNLKNGLIESQRGLKALNFTDPSKAREELFSHANLIVQSQSSISELAKFKGSRLERIIDSIQKNDYAETLDSKEKFINAIDKYGPQIVDSISLEAAKMIYKKLIYATIDLGKSGAQNGEVLNIYVTWMLDSKRDSLSNSPRLPIGKYYLRNTGWGLTVTDMFSLVKRINESKTDPTKVSPSNFKGSGGAVLMWTYRSEDHGLKIGVKKIAGTDTTYSVHPRRGFVNFLQPSIGLNVSYLDFSIDKDVEIGTGLQLGLFRNKIFFGYGYNLHLINPRGQSPKYFYIGFSFAKLDDLFKGGGSIKSIAN